MCIYEKFHSVSRFVLKMIEAQQLILQIVGTSLNDMNDVNSCQQRLNGTITFDVQHVRTLGPNNIFAVKKEIKFALRHFYTNCILVLNDLLGWQRLVLESRIIDKQMAVPTFYELIFNDTEVGLRGYEFAPYWQAERTSNICIRGSTERRGRGRKH